MTDLAEMIDAVDWSSYSHAYGAAVEMPEWLHGWLEGVPEEETAGEGLTASVFHQGDVHTAAEPLMPILLAALDGNRTDLHEAAMYWVAVTLGGDVCSWQADGFDASLSMCPPAHQAAAVGAPLFLDLIKNTELDEVRRAATSVLPWIPSQAAMVGEWLDRHIEQVESQIEPALLLATVDWHRRSRAHEGLFRRLMNGEEPATRVAGAVALARVRAADRAAISLLEGSLGGRLPGVPCQGLWCEAPPTDPVADAYLLTVFPTGGPAATGRLASAEATGLRKLIDAYPAPLPPDPMASAQQQMLARLQAEPSFPGAALAHFSLPPRRDQIEDVLSRGQIEQLPGRSGPDNEGRFHAPHRAARLWNVAGGWAGSDMVAVRGPESGTISLLSLHDGTESRRLMPAPVPEYARPPDAWDWPTVPQWLRAYGSFDGRWVAADAAGLVGVWEAADPQSCRYLDGFRPTRVPLAWAPDGNRMAAVGRDGLHVYETDSWERRLIETPPGNGGIAWSERLLATAGFGFGPVHVWDAHLGGPPTVAIERAGNMGAVALPPHQAMVAAPLPGPEPGITLARRAQGSWHRETLATPGHVSALAWSHSGAHLAAVVAGVQGSRLAIWPTEDEVPVGEPVLIPLGPSMTTDRALSWCPGREVVSVDQGHTVDIFSAETSVAIARLRPHVEGFVWETPRALLGEGSDWVSQRTGAHRVWQSQVDARPTLVLDPIGLDTYWEAVLRPELVFASFQRAG